MKTIGHKRRPTNHRVDVQTQSHRCKQMHAHFARLPACSPCFAAIFSRILATCAMASCLHAQQRKPIMRIAMTHSFSKAVDFSRSIRMSLRYAPMRSTAGQTHTAREARQSAPAPNTLCLRPHTGLHLFLSCRFRRLPGPSKKPGADKKRTEEREQRGTFQSSTG